MNIVCMEPLGITSEAFHTLAAPLIAQGHQVTLYPNRAQDDAALIQRIQEAEILILANQPLQESVLSHCPNLKMISIGFTGVDHVDTEYCRSRGIIMSNCAGYSTDAVAELVFGLMIAAARFIPACDKATRTGKDKTGLVGWELKGKTLGLIGTGAIGCRVAEIGKAFGLRLIAWSRSERPEAKALGVTYLPFQEVLAQSDILSLHVPANQGTNGLIGKEELALMKPTAILINTARGPVVDSAALAEALSQGVIAGAGLDVFDQEPPLAMDMPLLQAPHTVLTPHVAFATAEAMQNRAEIIFSNIQAYLQGTPQNLV